MKFNSFIGNALSAVAFTTALGLFVSSENHPTLITSSRTWSPLVSGTRMVEFSAFDTEK